MEATLEVRGMYCATCPVTVRTAAKRVPGVLDVRVSADEARAWVTYRPEAVAPGAIADAITRAGYPANVLQGSK
jgi:copper chaperone CopZ